MSVYSWPEYWWPSRFELRVMPNLRTFTGPYTPDTQVIDLLGERWMGTIELPPTEIVDEIAEREAFFDRLKGQAHQFEIFHLALHVPRGTIAAGKVTLNAVNSTPTVVPVKNGAGTTIPTVSGDPVVLLSSVAQLANQCYLQTRPGRTVKKGDMLGIAGQTVRSMVDATADGAGVLTLEFQPRARAAWAPYTQVVTTRPKIKVMLRTPEGVPTAWTPGYAEGVSFDFIEVP